jgi:CheY-like chemotaxis protein
MAERDRKMVLVVDDESYISMMVAMILRGEGFEVACAASGEEALKILDGGPVDLMITDMSMPGMSGEELVRAVDQSKRPIPCLIMTGHNPDEGAPRPACLRGHLVKPLAPETIIEAVRGALV